KARGTMILSAAIVLFVTVMMTLSFRERTAENALYGGGVLAVFGTIYLCSGLRFDFRNDLEQMEQIKAWPVLPPLVFLGTLLPQVVFVSGLLGAAILLRAAAIDAFHPAL